MDERIIFQFIQKLLDEEKVDFKPHALIRMIQRKITSDDVYEILRNPTYISKEVESSTYSGKYNYRIVGKKEWSVVVSVYFQESLVVITVID